MSQPVKTRCFGTGDALYERYHDQEWGRTIDDDADERMLFERLSLEAFQAGLSWVTILRKRDAFRRAFHGFVPTTVAAMTPSNVSVLLQDPGIIRNRTKIHACISNAQALSELHTDGRTLHELVTRHAPEPREAPPPSLTEVPSNTPGSAALAKELKRLGFSFVGPKTTYSLMQAAGYVNDHIESCWARSG